MPLTSSSRFNSSSNRSTSAVAKAKATTLEVANDGGKLHKRDGRSMTTFSTHIRNKIEINTNSLLFVHASNTYLGENDIWKYCQLADTAKVKSLLNKSKCSCDIRSARKKTPLHCAVMGGSLTLVELLLRKGADPVAKDDLGKTPLTYAENFDEDTKVDDETFVKTNKSIIKVLQRYKKLNEAKAKFASKKPTQKKTTTSFAEFRARAKSNLRNKGASSKMADID